VFCLLGIIDWPFFFALLACILTFGFFYSCFAIVMEVMTYNQYKEKGDLSKLLLTAFLEPFIFHPFVVWSAIKGHYDLIRKKKGWGDMTRQGFQQKKAA